MISVQNISKRYGTRTLFADVSFDMLAGEKVGLVGRNGHGKTTLFRIIAGVEEASSGRIAIPKHYSIGYLGQHLKFTKSTVLAEGCVGLPKDEIGSEWKVEKVLFGLGFDKEDMARKPSEFSGGFQMRIALTKALVAEPNMLLLDEPTNFLDILSIRWLEKFLHAWKNELIVISHDRDLVNSISTHIVGIHRGNVRKIKGSTGKYYAQLYQDEEHYEKKRIEDIKKREDMMKYVTKFRAKASHAKAVQSTIKKLEKMGDPKKLEDVRTLAFSFNHQPLGGQRAMDVQNLTFSYAGKEPYLISGLDFTVNKNDKICIIGKNGKGKTTLLKLLAGKLDPVAGTAKIHPAALPAYYEQANTASLSDDLTVEEEIYQSGPGLGRTRVRGICGAMMFSGDDAEKKIKVLSGGERSRVLLGKLLVAPSNILFLDEPTHHLDIESCQAMMDAVRDFEGTALVVAHDEHFLHEVATKLIVFKDDKVFFYDGTYREFLERVGWEGSVTPAPPAPATNKTPAAKPVTKTETKPGAKPKVKVQKRQMSRKERAQFIARRSKVLKPLEKQIKELEDEIAEDEEGVAEINRELIKDAQQKTLGALRRSELARELAKLKENIASCYTRLEAVEKEYSIQKQKYSDR